MKVAKLIELLQTMPQNANVMVVVDFVGHKAKAVLVDSDEKRVHIAAHTPTQLFNHSEKNDD